MQKRISIVVMFLIAMFVGASMPASATGKTPPAPKKSEPGIVQRVERAYYKHDHPGYQIYEKNTSDIDKMALSITSLSIAVGTYVAKTDVRLTKLETGKADLSYAERTYVKKSDLKKILSAKPCSAASGASGKRSYASARKKSVKTRVSIEKVSIEKKKPTVTVSATPKSQMEWLLTDNGKGVLKVCAAQLSDNIDLSVNGCVEYMYKKYLDDPTTARDVLLSIAASYRISEKTDVDVATIIDSNNDQTDKLVMAINAIGRNEKYDSYSEIFYLHLQGQDYDLLCEDAIIIHKLIISEPEANAYYDPYLKERVSKAYDYCNASASTPEEKKELNRKKKDVFGQIFHFFSAGFNALADVTVKPLLHSECIYRDNHHPDCKRDNKKFFTSLIATAAFGEAIAHVSGINSLHELKNRSGLHNDSPDSPKAKCCGGGPIHVGGGPDMPAAPRIIFR